MLCPHRKSVGLGLRPKLLGILNEHHICNQLVNVAAHVRQRVASECNRTNGKHVVSEFVIRLPSPRLRHATANTNHPRGTNAPRASSNPMRSDS